MKPALVWFRDDSRVSDNPALSAAVESGAPLLCFFIFDEVSIGLRPLGGAAGWWLHGSLTALDDSLRKRGSRLMVFAGPAAELVERIVRGTKAGSIFWNRRYTAAEMAVDRAIQDHLEGSGVEVRSFSGQLLNEPGSIKNKSDGPYRVFTPYLRAVRAKGLQRSPLPSPKALAAATWPAGLAREAMPISDLHLEPQKPNWASGFSTLWTRGESGAQARLRSFLDNSLRGYAQNRDHPGQRGTSMLSPHLRFGEISPLQIFHAIAAEAQAGQPVRDVDFEKLFSEIVWRDFCYQLLHDYPSLPDTSYDQRFERFPWRHDGKALVAWQQGRTGYPIVDAGMRQLWRTGWMHNRVRMIVASFLVKDLLIDWREGERWFWDTLVDADAASNAFNWQWVAGSGPDAAPFHRIFNPVTQGEKFDPDGAYIQLHIPELVGLPIAWIHRPWEAPHTILEKAGVVLGETYPAPIVRHDRAREAALQAFRQLRA